MTDQRQMDSIFNFWRAGIQSKVIQKVITKLCKTCAVTGKTFIPREAMSVAVCIAYVFPLNISNSSLDI